MSNPLFSTCCSDGKVKLPEWGEQDCDLKQLFTGMDESTAKTKHF